MIGYLNKPKSAYFDEDGFGKTGDLGYFDRHGGLYYVDRMKEVIKYCNNHVAPTELEDIIQVHIVFQSRLAIQRILYLIFFCSKFTNIPKFHLPTEIFKSFGLES